MSERALQSLVEPPKAAEATETTSEKHSNETAFTTSYISGRFITSEFNRRIQKESSRRFKTQKEYEMQGPIFIADQGATDIIRFHDTQIVPAEQCRLTGSIDFADLTVDVSYDDCVNEDRKLPSIDLAMAIILPARDKLLETGDTSEWDKIMNNRSHVWFWTKETSEDGLRALLVGLSSDGSITFHGAEISYDSPNGGSVASAMIR